MNCNHVLIIAPKRICQWLKNIVMGNSRNAQLPKRSLYLEETELRPPINQSSFHPLPVYQISSNGTLPCPPIWYPEWFPRNRIIFPRADGHQRCCSTKYEFTYHSTSSPHEYPGGSNSFPNERHAEGHTLSGPELSAPNIVFSRQP